MLSSHRPHLQEKQGGGRGGLRLRCRAGDHVQMQLVSNPISHHTDAAIFTVINLLLRPFTGHVEGQHRGRVPTSVRPNSRFHSDLECEEASPQVRMIPACCAISSRT